MTGVGARGRTRWVRAGMVAALAVLPPRDAHAHLVSTNLGPFYDGAAHALVSPEDLLTIAGLAIVAGHAGLRGGRRLLVALTLGWAAGVLAGFARASTPWEFPAVTATMILALGVAGASKVRLPADFLAYAAAAAGLLRGLLNGSAVRAAGGQWLSVVGVITGVFLLATLLTGSSAWLSRARAAVLLRVAASWVGAIGLLMLGWQVRG